MAKTKMSKYDMFKREFELDMDEATWQTCSELLLIMPITRRVDFSILPPELKHLSIVDAGYISLENMEKCTTLVDLKLESITLNSLSIPNEMANLKTIDISEAYIPEISIGSKIKLTSLEISLGKPNEITMLNFGDVSQLVYVDLFNVNASIPHKLPNLGDMTIYQGQAKVIPSIIPPGWGNAKRLTVQADHSLLMDNSANKFSKLWYLRLDSRKGMVSLLNAPKYIKNLSMSGEHVMMDDKNLMTSLESLDVCSRSGEVTLSDGWKVLRALTISAKDVTLSQSEFPLLRELRVRAPNKFISNKTLVAPNLTNLKLMEMPFIELDISESPNIYRLEVMTQHGHNIKFPEIASKLTHLTLGGVNVDNIPLELPANLGGLISLLLTGITTDITIPKTITKLTTLHIDTESDVNIRIPRVTPRLKSMLVPTNASISRY